MNPDALHWNIFVIFDRITYFTYSNLTSHQILEVQELPGIGGKTQWTTFNATSLPAKAEVNCLLDIISRAKRELTDTQFWQTAFLRQGLFIRKNQNEQTYWLIMGTLPDNVVASLWPAEKLKVEGSTKACWIPSASVQGKQHLNLASCFSIKTWRVVPTQVWSPMHAFIAKLKGLPPPLCHFQAGKEVPLLDRCAIAR